MELYNWNGDINIIINGTCCVVSNILDGHAVWLIEFQKPLSQSFVTVMIYTSEVHTFYSLHLENR